MRRVSVERIGAKHTVRAVMDDGSERVLVATLTSVRGVRDAAKMLGMDADTLLSLAAHDRAEWVPQAVATEPPPPAHHPVTVRPITQREGVQYPSMADALACNAGGGYVLTWTDRSAYCCLDVDPILPATRSDAERWLARLNPAPRWSWVSRSFGIHGIYEPLDGIPAEQVAAAAGYALWEREPNAKVELKADSRWPAHAVRERAQAWSQEREPGDESAIAMWLEDRGFAVGQRYPHTQCPVDPGESSGDRPVRVLERAIKCHVCESRGVRRGRHAPGWFPLEELADCPTDRWAGFVRNAVHWGHAKHFLPGPNARLAYAARLHRHWSEAREDILCAHPRVYRAENAWACEDGGTWGGQHLLRATATLPASQVHGAVTLAMPQDLGYYGYSTLYRFPGPPCYGEAHKTPVPFVYGSAPVVGGGDEGEAWAMLERAFPGIDRRVIELLLIGRGLSEGRLGSPLIAIVGPSGAGKTLSAVIAASIARERVSILPHQRSPERMWQGIARSREDGNFVVFDEFVKACKDSAKEMEFFLALSPDTRPHALYQGAIRLGSVPVCVVSDIEIPQAVIEHTQLARRFAFARLTSRKDWRKSCRDCGLRGAEHIREGGSEWARACDTIFAAIRDRWFLGDPPTWEEAARHLGLGMLEDLDPMREKEEAVRRLHTLLLAAPPGLGQWVGWWKVEGEAETILRTVGVHRVQEMDLADVLGLESPVVFEVRGNYARFRLVG